MSVNCYLGYVEIAGPKLGLIVVCSVLVALGMSDKELGVVVNESAACTALLKPSELPVCTS